MYKIYKMLQIMGLERKQLGAYLVLLPNFILKSSPESEFVGCGCRRTNFVISFLSLSKWDAILKGMKLLQDWLIPPILKKEPYFENEANGG